jgi:hypothetical protein
MPAAMIDTALRTADIDDGEVVLVDGQDLAWKRNTHQKNPLSFR